MAFQAHKCNQPGCKGFVVYDNADFDYDEAFQKREPLATPVCDTCHKEYAVGISHELFEIDEDGDPVATVPMVCYTEYDKAKKEDRLNRNIDAVIQALNQYQEAVSQMEVDEFDEFYNLCVKNRITNANLYQLRDSLKEVVFKTV